MNIKTTPFLAYPLELCKWAAYPAICLQDKGLSYKAIIPATIGLIAIGIISAVGIALSVVGIPLRAFINLPDKQALQSFKQDFSSFKNYFLYLGMLGRFIAPSCGDEAVDLGRKEFLNLPERHICK